MDLKNKKVLVVGMGKSGVAAAEVLVSLGADVAVYDKKNPGEIDPQLIQFFKNKNAQCYFGKQPQEISSFDLIVMSPGVPTDLAFIIDAQKLGVEVIGEVELAYRVGRSKYVAITGTNGKTTTTVLTGEIFKDAGRSSEVVGNVGLAVVSKALTAGPDTWMITEISSFQLETINEFHPVISALLNITPDHLDRHHTLENYAKVKSKIFLNQNEEDYFIVNYDDAHCMKLSEECKAVVVPFSRSKQLSFGCFVENNKIIIRNREGNTYEICETGELAIPGSHNLENALAAAAIGYFAGISPDSIGNTLRRFQGVAHRLEFCGDINGIRFINDSKGTNPDASIKAIEAMENKVVLIAGGYDKGSTFDELIDSFNGKVKALVLLGKTAPIIKTAAERKGFTNIITVRDMEECVREGFRAAESGDTVLLSPACASWDMYTSYEQRGEHFKSCVKNLEK